MGEIALIKKIPLLSRCSNIIEHLACLVKSASFCYCLCTFRLVVKFFTFQIENPPSSSSNDTWWWMIFTDIVVQWSPTYGSDKSVPLVLTARNVVLEFWEIFLLIFFIRIKKISSIIIKLWCKKSSFFFFFLKQWCFVDEEEKIAPIFKHSLIILHSNIISTCVVKKRKKKKSKRNSTIKILWTIYISLSSSSSKSLWKI